MSVSEQAKAAEILARAGVAINGSAPHDLHVHDPRLYQRVFAEGRLGLGESYMDGWWDVEDMPEFFFRVLRANLGDTLKNAGFLWYIARAKLLNMQTRSRSREVAEKHYDLDNDLYTAMLDPYMLYSCGYWSGNPPARDLNESQRAKLDLICKKLKLSRGQRVLDIGCGWGGFAKFAAEQYGVHVTGVTISKEQAELAKKVTAGLTVEIKLADYRDLEGQFDRIVSIGMFEHVGYKNYRSYMQTAHRLLKDDGLFLLHTIGSKKTVFAGDPWFDKYIFPNGMLPSVAQVGSSINKFFILEDWHNFGADYDKTLLAWHENFKRAWPQLQTRYDERFYRMWSYYLLSMAGAFRARQNQLWQIVLSKHGVVGGYASVR